MNAPPLRKQSPEAYALTLEKRRLEALLRDYKIDLKTAKSIVYYFFSEMPQK